MSIRNNRPLAYITTCCVLLLAMSAVAAPVKAPELIGGPSDWINTGGKAMHLYGPRGILPGHVVLIDFWEYTCINCIRTLPHVESWYAKYHRDGLDVIGIHSPEFKFAHDMPNVKAAVLRLGIDYPVVVDDDYKNWNAWHNDVWPREILIDSNGDILEDHEGEGDYSATEHAIRNALRRLGATSLPPMTDSSDQTWIPRTAETYCGYAKGASNNISALEMKHDTPQTFDDPAPQSSMDGMIGLTGKWQITAEALSAVGPAPYGTLTLAYHGPDCNAVIAPARGAVCEALVMEDGRSIPRADAGDDILYDGVGRSYIKIDQPRMYSLTRPTDYGEHIISIHPETAGFAIYSFSF